MKTKYPRYSVAADNLDIEEFYTKKEAIKFAKKRVAEGCTDVVVNIQDDDGDLIGLLSHKRGEF